MAYLDDVIDGKIDKMQFVQSEKNQYSPADPYKKTKGRVDVLNYIIDHPDRFSPQEVDTARHWLNVSEYDWRYARREISPLTDAVCRDRARVQNIIDRRKHLEDPAWVAKKIKEETTWHKFMQELNFDRPLVNIYTEEYFKLPVEEQIEIELDMTEKYTSPID